MVFDYCDGLIPVRSFVEKGQGLEGKPNNIWIDADGSAAEKLVTFANWAGREGAAVYVIPGTVAESGQAKSADVAAMQAIVVDIDTGDVGGKLAYLTQHLGEPSLVVESGGRTAEGAQKLHVWWKLSEPATGSDVEQVCALRGTIASKVAGDTHFRSAHQPIRVPGTIYHKGGNQRLVQILRHKSGHEVDLAAIAEAVAAMPAMPGIGSDAAVPDAKPSISDVLTTAVHEGGADSWSRFEGASAAIGHFIRQVHEGRISPDEGWEAMSMRKLEIELRNGPALPAKLIDKVGGQWVELNPMNERLVRKEVGARFDAERIRKHDVILGMLLDEAAAGRLFTVTQFTEKFENKGGLGSKFTIRDRISVLATKGFVKFLRDGTPFGYPAVRSRYGYLCVEGMTFIPEELAGRILIRRDFAGEGDRPRTPRHRR